MNLGIAITDEVDPNALPPHLRAEHDRIIEGLYDCTRTLFETLDRFVVSRLDANLDGRRYAYSGSDEADFALHLLVRKHHKIYRNDALHYAHPQKLSYMDHAVSYEIISLPAITGRIEMRLVDLRKNKTFWSALRDSTAIVPHDPDLFIFNPSKHPGLTHPDLIQAFLADIIHLQVLHHSAERALAVSDRWFISRPEDDIAAARDLLADMVASSAAEFDGNLPLEGRIRAILPELEGEQRVLLDIGARDGIIPKLRLEVWRSRPEERKVGQLEVSQVDSTTSTARVRKIERKFRQEGDGLEPGDRVVSRKRKPTRRGNSP